MERTATIDWAEKARLPCSLVRGLAESGPLHSHHCTQQPKELSSPGGVDGHEGTSHTLL